MLEIINYLKARYLSEKAQGIVEYALILAFVVIVAAAIGSSGDLQTKVKDVFTSISNMFGTKAANS
ncbi:MAG TPA: pilin protein [Selenomonas sp.]|nr:pilin protein [Selenomonas sp.]